MSAADSTARGSGLRGDVLILGLVVAAGLGLLLYFSSQRQLALRASAVGFEGLQVWLNAEGVSARSFTGGWTLDPDDIGLLVQPVFDTNLDSPLEVPGTEAELLLQQDEYDLALDVIEDKGAQVMSLVILPKWRSGMRLTGSAHPILLDDETGLRRIVRRLLGDDGAGLTRIRRPFVDYAYGTGTATLTARLYVPQVFSSPACRPVIGEDGAIVLGYCEGPEADFYLLSDPDLFNNHGLRLADNAAIAAHFLRVTAGGRDLVIDYSTRDWFAAADAPEAYERSWDDFKRFFAYPFLTLWLAGAFTLALVLWRAGRRYGPLIGGAEGPGSAKFLAIRARARLMRLTGQDGALVADYAGARLSALGVTLFGPAHGMDARALDRQFAVTFPLHHAELTAALAAIRALPAKTAAADAITFVTALEQILEKLENEPR